MAEEGVEFDLYDALNLQRGASTEEVRAAFRDLSRLYHPDKQLRSGSAAGGGAEAAFRRIHRAYNILGDSALRAFYDRYGHVGVRIAEEAAEEDEEGASAFGDRRLGRPEDKLQSLERRVQQLLRRHTELRAQRLLAVQGSFTLAAAAAPGVHGAHFRRRFRLQYTAMSHSVNIAPFEKLRLTVGCASHVQGANGVGAGKLMLAASFPVRSHTASVSLNVTGTSPELEASVACAVSSHCTLQQKVSVSREGCSGSLTLQPWLSRTSRGTLRLALGEDPGFSVSLVQRQLSQAHHARLSLSLRPKGTGDISMHLKYKPDTGFSIRFIPALSTRGWSVQAICTQVCQDGLSKVRWGLRLRQRSISVRLAFQRSGLRFALPLELWPDAAGPVPLQEFCLAVAAWAFVPFGLRLAVLLGRQMRDLVRRPAQKGSAAGSGGPAAAGAGGATPVEEPDDDVPAAAALALQQAELAAREAAQRREEEAAKRGLEVLVARYGDSRAVAEGSVGVEGVIDVTDVLMAKVRGSQLHISEAPKSTLIGFCDPRSGAGGGGAGGGHPLALYIRYRFGGREYSRTFGDREAVLLP